MICFIQASALGGSSVLSFISRHLDTFTETMSNTITEIETETEIEIEIEIEIADRKKNKTTDKNREVEKKIKVEKEGKKVKDVLRRNGKKEVLIIAVDDNKSAMKVTPDSLLNQNFNIYNNKDKNDDKIVNNDKNLYENVVYVRSYAECAGVLAAHKAGILLSSITAFVPKISVTRL